MVIKIYYTIFICLFILSLNGQSCLFDKGHRIKTPTDFLSSRTNPDFHIAVVVHIIEYQGSTQTISDQQVIDQISALNRDFNLLNNEWRFLPEYMKNIAANAGVNFYLANKDPLGEESIGITRTETNIEDISASSDIYYSEKGGHNPWPNGNYLNIWVADLSEGLLGFSSSPKEVGNASDGVVINNQAFGIRSFASPYYLGRSLVHEVGHYLGLLHPWGNLSGECEEDDGLSDTPAQEGPHRGCPPQDYKGCQTNEPIYWNFMDYTADCCMALFTKEQVELMWFTLYNYRASLVSFGSENIADKETNLFSKGVVIYPNPASDIFSIDWTKESKEKNIDFVSLIIYRMNGEKLMQLPLIQGRHRVEICTDSFPKGMVFLMGVTKAGINKHIGNLVVF